MTATFLATSFQTWLPHQSSNSSDDLLALLENCPCAEAIVFLRQLPVDTNLACQAIIQAMRLHQPQFVLCCGMAEGRQHLNLERHARCGDSTLSTTLPLDELVKPLSHTLVSHDAGSYVCNDTYYQILNAIQSGAHTHALFVHVPVLTRDNQDFILSDLCKLVDSLQCL